MNQNIKNHQDHNVFYNPPLMSVDGGGSLSSMKSCSFGPNKDNPNDNNNNINNNKEYRTVYNTVLHHDIDFGKSPSGKGGPRRILKAIRPPMSTTPSSSTARIGG